MGNPKTGGDDDIDAKGKYLLISVPDFAPDPIEPDKLMTSYLRLGAASTTWSQDPGGKLAEEINLGGPPGGRGDAPGEPSADAKDGTGKDRPVFVDDKRLRDGSPDPHGLSEDDREAQSKVLHERGGWRDHTDGNRITTTYGDKIEVIRGNYKLLVLGRQDDASLGAGLDVSGQHIQDFAYTWPAFQRVEWLRDVFGGAWHIQNTTDGAVTTENFRGDSYEFKTGNHFETTIGSRSPSNENVKPPMGNPCIVDRTWAQRIESYTGTTDCPIPLIQEETWADCITSLTDAKSTTETTNVSGAITSSTTAGSTSETTNVSGEIKSETTAGTIDESTSAGATTSATTVGASNESTIAGATNSMLLAGATNEMRTVGVASDLALVGAEATVKIAGESLSITGGLLQQDLKAFVSIYELVLAAYKFSHTFAHHDTSILYGRKYDVHHGDLYAGHFGSTYKITQHTHIATFFYHIV